ncbi:MAG: acyl-CoA reductase, partial [Rikenellaceae bacterium]
MNKVISTLIELRRRLLGSDIEAIYNEATSLNSWFSHSEIKYAMGAICSEFLDKEKLSHWMAHYPTLPHSRSENILIIMAGNIPLVGFFDMVCCLMAGHACYVKPSSKDRVLTEYIVNTLREIEPSTPIYMYTDGTRIDRVIATGSDTATIHFKSKWGELPLLVRGSRHSIAIITHDTTTEELHALTDDISLYSGLGCRSVAMIVTPKGYSLNLPKVKTNPKLRNNYLESRAVMTLRGDSFCDWGSLLGIESKEFSGSL